MTASRHHADHRDTVAANQPGNGPDPPAFIGTMSDAVIGIVSGG